MTAQIDDGFRYQGDGYAIAGISEGSLFDPALLDIQPVATCTACWRGYVAGFAVSEGRLVLDTLSVNLETSESEVGPVINGVQPTKPSGELPFFDNHYKGLDYHLEYSGGLLLASGFIRKLYVHMGFHPAWKYEKVLELIFENGLLQQEADRSDSMAEFRQRILLEHDEQTSSGMPTREEIREFVDRSFDRSYNM